MKPAILVDTAALIAPGNKPDDCHHQVVNLRGQLTQAKRQFLTTHAVLLELANTYSKVRYKSLAIQLINVINHSPAWQVIPTDNLLRQRGLKLFNHRGDKDWSLVDGISMVVAKDFPVTDSLTTDHHFSQAGFVILLKP